MKIQNYSLTRTALLFGALVCCLLSGISAVSAQSDVHTPKVGSDERKAIMDALRVPVERELKQSVVFVVKTLRVQDGWAFVKTVPQQSNGHAVDLSSEVGAGSDGTVTALLRQEGGKWSVITHALGSSKAVGRWPTLYRAPRSLFESGGSAGAPGSGTMYTPKAGSAERKALMDALRPSVEKDLKQSIVFEVKTLHVLNGWAFFYGIPRRSDGKPIDYSRTIYAEAVKAGAFGGDVCTLYHKVNGHWKVVTSRLGPTDVAWETWDRDYHAPKAIFQMNNG